MKKRGQFYLIAVILLITVFLGFLTATNFLKKEKLDPTSNLETEIQLEKNAFLDYLSSQQKTPDETYTLEINFSREFQNRLGTNKEVVFIVGNETNLTILGTKKNETTLEYNSGGGFNEIEASGEFFINIDPSSSNFNLKIENITKSYFLYGGQNIYYLVKYDYNEEVYIIDG